METITKKGCTIQTEEPDEDGNIYLIYITLANGNTLQVEDTSDIFEELLALISRP